MNSKGPGADLSLAVLRTREQASVHAAEGVWDGAGAGGQGAGASQGSECPWLGWRGMIWLVFLNGRASTCVKGRGWQRNGSRESRRRLNVQWGRRGWLEVKERGSGTGLGWAVGASWQDLLTGQRLSGARKPRKEGRLLEFCLNNFSTLS